MLHHRCVTAQPSTLPRAPGSAGTRRRGQMLRSGDSRRKGGIPTRSRRTRIGPSVQRVTSRISPHAKGHQESQVIKQPLLFPQCPSQVPQQGPIPTAIGVAGGPLSALSRPRTGRVLPRTLGPNQRGLPLPPFRSLGGRHAYAGSGDSIHNSIPPGVPGGRTQSYSEKLARRSTAPASDGDALAARPISQWSRTNRHHWSL